MMFKSCPVTGGHCCVCRELKVVTGEWFLEERSKRFEQGVPSGDVIKQTILSSPSESHYESFENCNAVIQIV